MKATVKANYYYGGPTSSLPPNSNEVGNPDFPAQPKWLIIVVTSLVLVTIIALYLTYLLKRSKG